VRLGLCVFLRLGVCVFLSTIVAGCGARTSGSAELPQPQTASPGQMPAEVAPASASLSEFIAKARVLATQARPPARPSIAQIESTDHRLAAAIVEAKTLPSPEAFRRVAEEYHRLKIYDRAHDYLHRATLLDPRDAATYDALARLWRDGGLPQLALADAHRALYYSPDSPAAHNTLGTILQALGQRKQAQREYERALQLDPAAAYALNNLCYGWILDREPGKAVTACQAALKIDPGLAAARNNLGLAYASRGDLDATRGAFERVGDRATALYNLGIVYMGRRQYSDAVSAFAAAQQARPSFPMATVRAEQAEKLALAGAD
jgi:tetratricopeptide (TPR) repeat protein